MIPTISTYGLKARETARMKERDTGWEVWYASHFAEIKFEVPDQLFSQINQNTPAAFSKFEAPDQLFPQIN